MESCPVTGTRQLRPRPQPRIRQIRGLCPGNLKGLRPGGIGVWCAQWELAAWCRIRALTDLSNNRIKRPKKNGGK